MLISSHKWKRLSEREVPPSIAASVMLRKLDVINQRYGHTDMWIEEAFVCGATQDYKVLLAWHTRQGEPNASEWYYVAVYGSQTIAEPRWRQP